jgi:hypothetical protein
MYLLPSAYNKYYEQCSEYGGQLSLSYNNYKCTNITVKSEQDCEGSFTEHYSNGDPNLTTCSVTLMGVLDGELYTAKDLRAISCLPGMDVKNQITGNCDCKEGYYRVCAQDCIPGEWSEQYSTCSSISDWIRDYEKCWYTGGNWRFDTLTCQ